MRASLFAAAFLLSAAFATSVSVAGAPVHKSCEIIPHGRIVGVSTNGCTLAGDVTQLLYANVTVVAGTIDAIEIDTLGPGGERRVFVCTFSVTTSVCILPVQTSARPGAWSVTARVAAADPLGLFLGGFDSYARLDATFV